MKYVVIVGSVRTMCDCWKYTDSGARGQCHREKRGSPHTVMVDKDIDIAS